MTVTTARLSPLLACIISVAASGNASPADDVPAGKAPAAAAPDGAALDALLQAGDYARAVAVADEIVTISRPKPRDQDYLRRSVDVIKALMRRGFAELRLGRVDAAEATFGEVADTFKDREFQRQLNLAARGGGAKVVAALVELELTRLDLLYSRMKVIIAQLGDEASRQVGGTGEASTDDPEELQATVDRYLDRFDSLGKQVADARESFLKRFGSTGGEAVTSPVAHALVGPFWTALLEGLAAFERSRLPRSDAAPKPATGDSTASSPSNAPPDVPPDLRATALEYYEKADEALRAIAVAVSPKTGALRASARIEIALLEIELLVARARVWIDMGDTARARRDSERIFELRREVGTLRKDPKPEVHPEQFVPLLLGAELGIMETRDLLAEGKVDAARTRAVEVQRMLDVAASLQVPEDHPLQARVTSLRESLDGQRAGVDQSIPRSESLDAAARRMIRGIGAAAFSEPGGNADSRPSAVASP